MRNRESSLSKYDYMDLFLKQFQQHGRAGEPQDSEWKLASGRFRRRQLNGANTLVCLNTIEYDDYY